MAKKKAVMTNAMRMLAKSGIEYEIAQYNADEIGDDFGCKVADLLGIDRQMSFKTLAARGDKTGVIVACIPVQNELDLKKLAKVSGNKSAELIHVKELLSVTGYVRGSVSPIGMKKKYPTYFDMTAQNNEKIAISAGICGGTLIMKPEDVQKATDCIFEEITKDLQRGE